MFQLTIFIENKVMLLAATAYNLKKMLKFSKKRFKEEVQKTNDVLFTQNPLLRAILSLFETLKKYELKFVPI